MSTATSWERAVFLKQKRRLYPSNSAFGEFLKLAVGCYPFLLKIPSSNVQAKLILCATYLTRDEYMELGYGKAAELMSRVEEFHERPQHFDRWNAFKRDVIRNYRTLKEVRAEMNDLISRVLL